MSARADHVRVPLDTELGDVTVRVIRAPGHEPRVMLAQGDQVVMAPASRANALARAINIAEKVITPNSG